MEDPREERPARQAVHLWKVPALVHPQRFPQPPQGQVLSLQPQVRIPQETAQRGQAPARAVEDQATLPKQGREAEERCQHLQQLLSHVLNLIEEARSPEGLQSNLHGSATVGP